MDRSTVLDFRLFCHHPPGSWPGGWIELIRRSIRLLLIVQEYFRVGQDVYRSVLVAQAVQIGFDGVLGSLLVAEAMLSTPTAVPPSSVTWLA